MFQTSLDVSKYDFSIEFSAFVDPRDDSSGNQSLEDQYNEGDLESVEVVQFTTARERGQRSSVSPIKVQPLLDNELRSILGDAQESNLQSLASFRRIQIRKSTLNNGATSSTYNGAMDEDDEESVSQINQKSKSTSSDGRRQQYYILKITLWASLKDSSSSSNSMGMTSRSRSRSDQRVKVATSLSERVTVHGRSKLQWDTNSSTASSPNKTSSNGSKKLKALDLTKRHSTGSIRITRSNSTLNAIASTSTSQVGPHHHSRSSSDQFQSYGRSLQGDNMLVDGQIDVIEASGCKRGRSRSSSLSELDDSPEEQDGMDGLKFGVGDTRDAMNTSQGK